jgi:hypothetical protein
MFEEIAHTATLNASIHTSDIGSARHRADCT